MHCFPRQIVCCELQVIKIFYDWDSLHLSSYVSTRKISLIFLLTIPSYTCGSGISEQPLYKAVYRLIMSIALHNFGATENYSGITEKCFLLFGSTQNEPTNRFISDAHLCIFSDRLKTHKITIICNCNVEKFVISTVFTEKVDSEHI